MGYLSIYSSPASSYKKKQQVREILLHVKTAWRIEYKYAYVHDFQLSAVYVLTSLGRSLLF